MGEVVTLGFATPVGWRYVYCSVADSWFERPVGGGMAIVVMLRRDGYEALVPGVDASRCFRALADACGWAERAYCGCVVRR